MVPSSAIAALLQNFIARPSTRSHRTSTVPLPVETRSSPRTASQTSRSPSSKSSSPNGRPPVSATRRMLPLTGSTAQIAPSSVPV